MTSPRVKARMKRRNRRGRGKAIFRWTSRATYFGWRLLHEPTHWEAEDEFNSMIGLSPSLCVTSPQFILDPVEEFVEVSL